jgi:hypothetical protein
MNIHQTMTGQATTSIIPTIQLSDVHSVQSMNLKGTQQPRGKKKGKDKKEVGIMVKMLINMILMLEGLRKRRGR